MRGTHSSAFRREVEQQTGDALIRLLEGDRVELGGEHADRLRQVGQQTDCKLRFAADALHKAPVRDRDNFGAAERFCRRNARQAVEKSRFPEDAAGFHDRKRFFRAVFRAEKNPHAAAFQIVELVGVASLPVDHFAFFIDFRRPRLLQHAPAVLFRGVHPCTSFTLIF